MLEIEGIDHISDEMHAVVESEWPVLALFNDAKLVRPRCVPLAEPAQGRMMTIKDRHWRSIRPKATNMTMPVIIPTSSAAVIISIISSAPSRQTMGRSLT
jgi:hypothetical protein